MIYVAGAQSSLYVRDGKLSIVGRERGCHRGSGIALDNHPIKRLTIEDVTDTQKQSCGKAIEALIGLHQV
jgi:hypothetical protein